MTFKTIKQLFDYIWETREHLSELTGEPLLPKGHPKWHWQFLHVLPKNYKKFAFDPRNILLGLPEEHEHQNDFEVFNKKYEELHRLYYEEVYGRKF